MRSFGAHTIDNGGIHMAARRAASAGMRALQLFTAIPKFYNDKVSIRPERAERFLAAVDEVEIPAGNILVHAAYVLSVATPDPDKYARAAAGLRKELERSSVITAGAVCFHPGSAGTGPLPDALERVAAAMTEAIRAVPGQTRLLIENTAGAGKTVGRTAQEIAQILELIPGDLRERAGYGLDTCHLFASGYDIHTSAERLSAILDEFEAATGEAPSFFHLNDSAGEFASNRDRHMLLGAGNIGAEPFRWLVADKRTKNVPLILETPQQNPDIGDDDESADPYDVQMMELLKSFE